MGESKRVAAILCLLMMGFMCTGTSEGGEEHSIDLFEQECIETNMTTSGMANCTYAALDKWEQEMNRYYNLLLERLDKEQRGKLRHSQQVWLNYRDAEFENVSSIYSHEKGTMYINVIASDQREIVKRRALDLRNYYEMLENEFR